MVGQVRVALACLLQDLARQYRHLRDIAVDTCDKCIIVERVVQCAVEVVEPADQVLVQQPAIAGGDALGGIAHAPIVQHLLHCQVHVARVQEVVLHAREQTEMGDTPAAEQRRQQRPVIGVIPDHLDRHHLLVAEQRVLILIQRQGVFVEREIQLLVQLHIRAERFAGAVAADQFADVGVGDGDEVAAGRIERIQEHARFAG
ncbi:hypothetical protein XAUB_05260 [Xanthomonas citri pv. aurantifolii str. ICPB 11122]|nr:hypothetical protein XAUB_05260 [Xanthomonas citri pv. aurantifolii str. ICPB 11122]